MGYVYFIIMIAERNTKTRWSGGGAAKKPSHSRASSADFFAALDVRARTVPVPAGALVPMTDDNHVF
jgi:hypothetical protein